MSACARLPRLLSVKGETIMEETVLTTSELRAFQQCRWQWNWKYNERLVPKQLSNKLVIGICVHQGLEGLYGPNPDEYLTVYEQAYADQAKKVLEHFPELDVT